MYASALLLVLLASPALAEWAVIDGDTLRDTRTGEVVRLVNVDAPELNGKCPQEVAMARKAREYVQNALRGSVVSLERVPRVDRYGRTLARVYVAPKEIATGSNNFKDLGPKTGSEEITPKDLGEALVREGLARKWDGRRRSWCDG